MLLSLGVASCDMFSYDNYDEPSETLKINVIDETTGKPYIGSYTIEMLETSWENASPKSYSSVYKNDDSEWKNTKLFAADYNVRVDGAFIPLVLKNTQNDTIVNKSQDIKLKGTKTLEYKVKPYLHLEVVKNEIDADGKLHTTIKVDRAVSREEFKAAIEPTGNYEDKYADITDVNVIVSRTAYGSGVNVFSPKIKEFSDASFDAELGKEYTFVTDGALPKGRKYFISCSAAIRYTHPKLGGKQYNYSNIVEFDVK